MQSVIVFVIFSFDNNIIFLVNKKNLIERKLSQLFCRSCDCLTQTDISAVLTPRNEQMPPNPETQYLQFKRVDISLETSDSEATSSAAGAKKTSLKMTSASAATSDPNDQERQSRLVQQQQQHSRDRSKSPRPQTLPGLVKASAEERPASSPQVSSLKVRTLKQDLSRKLFLLSYISPLMKSRQQTIVN